MLTTDMRCNHPSCSTKGIYRMVGKCTNCKAEPVLLLFTAGHQSEAGKCPVCENERSVYAARLATEDEIPVA